MQTKEPLSAASTPGKGPTPLEIVARYETAEPITNHPYTERLQREPVNLFHLWKLLANFQISISKNFARKLAGLAARVDDDETRTILACQLNDEMGNGVYARAHTNLFSNMMSKLERWKPPLVDEQVLAPGSRLAPRLIDIYENPDVYVGIGAVIAGEIFGKQMDQFIAGQFRRQNEVDISSLAWVVLHETLEVSHADSSPDLARLVPASSYASAARGAETLAQAGRTFFSELYELCYERAVS